MSNPQQKASTCRGLSRGLLPKHNINGAGGSDLLASSGCCCRARLLLLGAQRFLSTSPSLNTASAPPKAGDSCAQSQRFTCMCDHFRTAVSRRWKARDTKHRRSLPRIQPCAFYVARTLQAACCSLSKPPCCASALSSGTGRPVSSWLPFVRSVPIQYVGGLVVLTSTVPPAIYHSPFLQIPW